MLGQKGSGLEASEQIHSAGTNHSEPSCSLGRARGVWGQAWGMQVPQVLQAGLGAPLLLLFFLFPILCPTPGASQGAPESGPEHSSSRLSLQDLHLKRLLPPLDSGAEAALDLCTNLCTPLYICCIECIYVGNMLASAMCRCCALCTLQHQALAGKGATARTPLPTQPPPAQASPSASLSLPSVLSMLR